MFHLTISIDREVSVEELKIFVQACSCIRDGDRFVVTTDEVPAKAPSKPVIVADDRPVMAVEEKPELIAPKAPEPAQPRHYTRRPWSVRIEDAFNKTLQTLPRLDMEIQCLRIELAWDIPKEEWSEIEVRKASFDSVRDMDSADCIFRCILKNLGMQPPASARRLLLPPKTEEWEATLEARQKAQREANLKNSGDEHIGFPIDWHPTEATADRNTLHDVLASLDWDSKDRRIMSTKEFLESFSIPYTQGNAVKLGIVARDFGGLEVAEKKRGLLKYAFPPVRK